MKEILIVFITLLITTAVLYYLKVYRDRDTYINVQDALSAQNINDQYSTLLRLESTGNNLYIDQEKLVTDLKQYNTDLDKKISSADKRMSQLQVNTNSQLENIRKTHLLNQDVVSRFSSNLTDLTERVAKDSEWTHVVYGEVIQTTKNQQRTLDDLTSNYTLLNTTVQTNNTTFNTKINNIAKDVNTAFSSVAMQLNQNNDKTFADVNQLANNVTQINMTMAQANSSIGQVNNNLSALKADYLPKNVFQSSIADLNNSINNLKNDYVSKAALTNSITPLQNKFANYSTTQDVAANYYPLKSGQALEGSVKTMEGKVANIGNTPDYVTKAMLANYYDKPGVDSTITTKLSGYVTTANGATLYYPLKSGQTLETIVKGFDTKVASAAINANTINAGKLCLGATCILDEITLKKVFDVQAAGLAPVALVQPARAAATFTVDKYPPSYVVNDVIKFDFTGGSQTFKLLNAKRVLIKVWGGAGGNGNSVGGQGGFSEGQYDLKGDLLVYIGGVGATAPQSKTSANGGWNGGGSGGFDQSGGNGGGGGGGGTDVRTTTDLNSRIIVAGGGGGGNVSNIGGSGGGSNGGDGQIAVGGCSGQGRGGTQSSGGSSVGRYATGGSGGLGQGGNGATNAYTYGSGGGGGGYFGGGGGAADAQHGCGHGGSGGGGSGYIGGVQNGTMSTGGRSGNGYVEITVLQVGLLA